MEQVKEEVSCTGEKFNKLEQIHNTQEWADGSRYVGNFAADVKLGHGEFIWANGEKYVGEFYKDHPHGKGIYIWPDISTFTGSFYLGRKEGYGTMEFKDNGKYQGLYRAGERFGPGIETYQDDCQDVGIWLCDHLIRLSTKIPGSFLLSQDPEYVQTDENPQQTTLYENDSSIWTFSDAEEEEEDPFFYNYKLLLLNDSYTLPEKIHIYSSDTDHLPITYSFRKEFDSKFFQDNEQLFDADDLPPPIRNVTPLMVKMQKHIYKHRHSLTKISWDVRSILNGSRESFGPKGPKELISEQLIIKAAEGDDHAIYEILRDNLAHVDVADISGHTALHAAAARCHDETVNLLLDNGADVNKLNDEGLSALSVCLVFYYPAESFKQNIAERNFDTNKIEKIEDFSSEPNQIPLEAESDDSKIKIKQHPVTQSNSCFDIDSPETSKCFITDFHYAPVEEIIPTAFKSNKYISEKNADFRYSNSVKGSDVDHASLNEKSRCSPETNIFESNCSILNFGINISEDVLQWSADILSHNFPMQVRSSDKGSMQEGTVRKMAQSKYECRHKWATIELLLRRGADPNISCVPMHALFFAIKAADVKAVKLLLEKGARTDVRFPLKLGGLTPLHIAVAIPGIEGVSITELLLHAVSDPDARAEDRDYIFEPDRCGNSNIVTGFPLKGCNAPEVFCNYYLKPNIVGEEGGRTPLHVVCEREDCHKRARDIVHLLLKHSANPNILWSGHSPLSLAIASGNDLAVKELLANGAEPNLPLGRDVGSALCAAVNPAYEQKRTLQARISLIDRLIKARANILMPISIGNGTKTAVGTAVDYGYYKFFQDKRIAHTPYHALMPGERDTLNGRKLLLEHMGDLVREAVTMKEKEWTNLELQKDIHGMVTSTPKAGREGSTEPISSDRSPACRKSSFKYCYQCGRAVGVRLSPCPRCHAVSFCSKGCKKKSWNERHKDECVRPPGKFGVKSSTQIGKKEGDKQFQNAKQGSSKAKSKGSHSESHSKHGSPSNRKDQLAKEESGPSTGENYSFN